MAKRKQQFIKQRVATSGHAITDRTSTNITSTYKYALTTKGGKNV